ncbi:MAG: TorF family putative porin, partial [Deltaproteobacteria bacterium]
MKTVTKLLSATAASLALAAASVPASADEFGYSITIGGTSDYVFRGFSQTNRDPAAQGSFDVTYGLWYAGIWASNVSYPNFGGPCIDVATNTNNCAPDQLGDIGPAEIDYYIGAKPVWGP